MSAELIERLLDGAARTQPAAGHTTRATSRAPNSSLAPAATPATAKHDTPDLLGEFVALLDNRFTRDGYGAALERFAAFCAERDTDPARADRLLIEAFRDELAGASAAGTVRFALAAVSSFFRWLGRIGERADNPAATLERPPRQVDNTHPLAPGEATALIERTATQAGRPFALCCLFLLYAPPTSAAAELDAADVRATGLEGPQLRARLHGGRRELVALCGPAERALVAQAGAVDPGGPLFPGTGRRGRTGRHALCEEVARGADAVLERRVRVTPQILRATHQAAVRTLLAPIAAGALGDSGRQSPPRELAAAVWEELRRQASTR